MSQTSTSVGAVPDLAPAGLRPPCTAQEQLAGPQGAACASMPRSGHGHMLTHAPLAYTYIYPAPRRLYRSSVAKASSQANSSLHPPSQSTSLPTPPQRSKNVHEAHRFSCSILVQLVHTYSPNATQRRTAKHNPAPTSWARPTGRAPSRTGALQARPQGTFDAHSCLSSGRPVELGSLQPRPMPTGDPSDKAGERIRTGNTLTGGLHEIYDPIKLATAPAQHAC